MPLRLSPGDDFHPARLRSALRAQMSAASGQQHQRALRGDLRRLSGHHLPPSRGGHLPGAHPHHLPAADRGGSLGALGGDPGRAPGAAARGGGDQAGGQSGRAGAGPSRASLRPQIFLQLLLAMDSPLQRRPRREALELLRGEILAAGVKTQPLK